MWVFLLVKGKLLAVMLLKVSNVPVEAFDGELGMKVDGTL